MSDVSFRKTGWTANWAQTGSAGSGGPGRRNQYMATPSGPVEKSNDPPLGEVGTPVAPRYQPFNPANIVQVNLGDILEKEHSSAQS